MEVEVELDVENGGLVKINWIYGGWLDSSHFNPPEVDAYGSCSFTTFDGKNYDVQIDGTGGCGYSNSSPDEDDEVQEEEVESENEGEEEIDFSILQHSISKYNHSKVFNSSFNGKKVVIVQF